MTRRELAQCFPGTWVIVPSGEFEGTWVKLDAGNLNVATNTWADIRTGVCLHYSLLAKSDTHIDEPPV